MNGCLVIVLLFLLCLLLYVIITAITKSSVVGIIGLVAVIIYVICRAHYENTPEGINEIKKKHQEAIRRSIENASKCPRCKSSNMSTSWVDTWKIGKIGRDTVYICNDCGKEWQINSNGDIKTL